MKLNEVLAKVIAPNDGTGIEITIDQSTAKWAYDFYEIRAGKKTKISEAIIQKSKIYPLLERAVNAVRNTNVRRKFAAQNINTIDIVGYLDTATRTYKVIATSDDGTLQLTFNNKTGKFV